MKDIRGIIGEDEHDKRMAAARARAEWELGDASWAGLFVGAYLEPEADTRALAQDKDEVHEAHRSRIAARDVTPPKVT